MSSYTDASLIILPDGGYQAGVKALKPADANLVPTGVGDFVFDRNSDATFVGSDGLIQTASFDIPRFDYSGRTCPVILAEPQSTNLATYSEDLTNAAWVKTTATITSNSETAPDGTLTADTLTATAANGQVQQVYTGSSATTYTASFYIKRKTGTGNIYLRSVENTNTLITVTNEWTRVDLATTSTSTSIRIGIRIEDSGDEVYLWGAQLEQLDYATSYIPNLTTGSSTRQADLFNQSGSLATFDDDKGVLYVEMGALFNTGAFRSITISDGSVSNVVEIYLSSTNNTIGAKIVVGGANQAEMTATVGDFTDINNVAIQYNLNDFRLFINGIKVGEDTSGSVFTASTLDELRLDNGVGGQDFEGEIQYLSVQNQVLTDLQLEDLSGFDTWNDMATELNYTIE